MKTNVNLLSEHISPQQVTWKTWWIFITRVKKMLLVLQAVLATFQLPLQGLISRITPYITTHHLKSAVPGPLFSGSVCPESTAPKDKELAELFIEGIWQVDDAFRNVLGTQWGFIIQLGDMQFMIKWRKFYSFCCILPTSRLKDKKTIVNHIARMILSDISGFPSILQGHLFHSHWFWYKHYD